MILAAGILCFLILAFCLCLRRHELVYYWTGEDAIVYMEPPEGRSFQYTITWLSLFRLLILIQKPHIVYWQPGPPRHFNRRSQVVPVMETDGKIERWYGPCHPPIGEFIPLELGEPVVRIVIDHEADEGWNDGLFHSPNCRRLMNEPGDCSVCDRVRASDTRRNLQTLAEVRKRFGFDHEKEMEE